ncbi:nucleotidyltransferase family protein [Janibacter indicus]|uniref:Uncharacterized nucleotidyltransferase n=1 Tax=Janibacter indicus TaxID=857417 RepID=A0A1W1Y686_9MICO|nr:nucleotidyltransferase family protein [Janibacter indicus]SMC31238.1 Uncharacterised nucleotidyltransferase [Janibacter indicus]
MSSIPLTLAEAVPLGTVWLQRLLADAGIRSLAIKGPAFVELGVRRPRQSNDIDLLVAPEVYATATDVLVAGGWKVVSYNLPPGLEHTKYSVTLRHDQMPATVDLHQRFEGMLAQDVFDTLWHERESVVIAHQEVTTVGRDHALIMELLNAVKPQPPTARAVAAGQVVDRAAVTCDPHDLAAAARAVGARHTAADLIVALGGERPTDPPSSEEAEWIANPFSYNRLDLLRDTMRQAPHHLPQVLLEQLLLTPDAAKFWALTNDLEYRGRVQVLWHRVRRQMAR